MKAIPWLSKLTLISIIVLMSIMWSNLGRDYLFDWDEGIYATIGREMSLSRNFLTPTWNSDLWLEKPPIIGWVTMLGITLAGDNELGARLLMPLFAGLTLFAIFKIGEKIGGTYMGTMSTAMLGYFNLFLSRARTLNSDLMLLTAITWSVWLILAGSSPWLVGLMMGIAIMVKGPAGILAIMIAIPLLIKKDKKFLLYTLYSILIVILPWHLYQYFVHGSSFFTPYLLEQVIRRATVPIEFHTESRWFYFNFLFKDLGIGVILVSLLGLGLVLQNFKHIFIAWWIAIPLVLFTLAKTRLSWYILPVYPAVALGIGYALSFFSKDRRGKVVLSILAVGMIFQMLWHGFAYIDFKMKTTSYSNTIQVARELSKYEGANLAMLVSPSERVAQAILPADQTISSSFRYGGAPSVVWYSHKHVTYYYNYDNFIADTKSSDNFSAIIVSVLDADKVSEDYKLVSTTKEYLGFIKGDNYALR